MVISISLDFYILPEEPQKDYAWIFKIAVHGEGWLWISIFWGEACTTLSSVPLFHMKMNLTWFHSPAYIHACVCSQHTHTHTHTQPLQINWSTKWKGFFDMNWCSCSVEVRRACLCLCAGIRSSIQIWVVCPQLKSCSTQALDERCPLWRTRMPK